MNSKNRHHAAIFTSYDGNVHFLITEKCTSDDASQTVYKPHLMDQSISLAAASFQVTEQLINDRKMMFGESTGEDGVVLWRHQFHTVEEAVAALHKEMESVRDEAADRLRDLSLIVTFEATVAELKRRGVEHPLARSNGAEKQIPVVKKKGVQGGTSV